MIKYVERINAVLDKQRDPYKRQDMRKEVRNVALSFAKILEKEMNK